MALSPILIILGNWPSTSILPENGIQHLYLIMWEHIPQSHQSGSTLTSDHGRNQSSHHVRMAMTLHLTMGGPILPPCQNGFALTSDHVGTHPIVTSKWPSAPSWVFLVTDQVPLFSWIMAFNTYIWSCGNTSSNHIRMALHLYMIMWEHIPQSYQNGPHPQTKYSW